MKLKIYQFDLQKIWTSSYNEFFILKSLVKSFKSIKKGRKPFPLKIRFCFRPNYNNKIWSKLLRKRNNNETVHARLPVKHWNSKSALSYVYINRAFSKTRHISITLIELSLITILAPPSVHGYIFWAIMIMWLQVPSRVTSMFRYIMMLCYCIFTNKLDLVSATHLINTVLMLCV
jgi:hypothetical protein